MVVGMRKLSEKEFTKSVLSSKSETPPRRGGSSTVQGWGSHNYIVMAVDRDGFIHLSGNMHANQLTYFRSGKPGDVTTMEQVDAMVGSKEDRCTYPKFMNGHDGSLLFHYRDGGSGDGDEIYNVYDEKTRKWRRFLDASLIAGQGKRNAYQNGPKLGPDGWYHLLWVWRETPDAATTHDLSYARSRDLTHWETASGKTLTLPITIDSKGTIIDPVPVRGGIINGCHKFDFDSKNRVVVTYHKHDKNGNTQAYAARCEDGKWIISQISDWKDRHVFQGRGSAPSTFGTSLKLGTIGKHGKGKLALSYSHWKEGSGLLVIDEQTLAPVAVESQSVKTSRIPRALTKVTSDFEGMGVRWCEDSGSSPDSTSRYVLRWESLESHRDQAREEPLPENQELVLYRIGRGSE
ncbi:MAG: hypothetical protein ACI81V_000780 [Lentimonas sp.]|jgi:hypothetical protein